MGQFEVRLAAVGLESGFCVQSGSWAEPYLADAIAQQHPDSGDSSVSCQKAAHAGLWNISSPVAEAVHHHFIWRLFFQNSNLGFEPLKCIDGKGFLYASKDYLALVQLC